jgi:hypothetical protein
MFLYIYMGKKAVMISVDEYVHKRAKDGHINISAVSEVALAKKVGHTLDAPEEDIRCKKCGKQEAKETKTTIGMTWLCPDECWICSGCLKHEVNKNVIGIVTG